ncbi:MAG: hypothetical protein MK179_09640 [Pirellulaceae bacterium]|nr:hypothetical protein [Pirellulaceae bacterium]
MSSPKPESTGHVSGPKPQSNVYTAMLVVALICVITSCVLLYLELQRFGEFPQWKL